MGKLLFHHTPDDLGTVPVIFGKLSPEMPPAVCLAEDHCVVYNVVLEQLNCDLLRTELRNILLPYLQNLAVDRLFGRYRRIFRLRMLGNCGHIV